MKFFNGFFYLSHFPGTWGIWLHQTQMYFYSWQIKNKSCLSSFQEFKSSTLCIYHCNLGNPQHYHQHLLPPYIAQQGFLNFSITAFIDNNVCIANWGIQRKFFQQSLKGRAGLVLRKKNTEGCRCQQCVCTQLNVSAYCLRSSFFFF